MNWREVQWGWKGTARLLQTHWTKLTDEDLERIDAHRDELAKCLQRRYGYSAEEAERAICSFEKDVRFPGAVK
jgi:uncharacterized protein YjbJ (UPF0337 family)